MTFPDDSIYPKIEGTIDEKDGCSMVYENKPLTKREYFAAMALQGILADTANADCSQDTMALYAVGCADALIERLNKNNYNPALDTKNQP